MHESSSPLSTLKSIVVTILVVITPLFFLPLTQEFFIINKLYFLSFGAVILLGISGLELLISKKIVWHKKPFDTGVFLLLITTGLSILISSPNKVQALVNSNYGLVMLVSFAILYYYLSRSHRPYSYFLGLSASIISVLSILFFFQPFKSINLPVYFQFLKNPFFTPVGSYLDLVIFLGFVVILEIGTLLSNKKNSLSVITLTLTTLGFLLTLYAIFQPSSSVALVLPPVKQSWFAAVEILKSPVQALFGVGVDNFASLFTRAKDISYNQSPALWQINTFAVSRSTFLHVFSEAGLFGLVSLLLLIIGVVTKVKPSTKNALFLPSLFLLLVMFMLPPSFFVFFLFFILLSLIMSSHDEPATPATVMNLAEMVPIYLGLATMLLLFILGAFFLLGRGYLAEFTFKKSLDAIPKNDAQNLYENQRQAVILNPFIERFHANFAQTNLLIANNVANRISQTQVKNPKAPISEQDRQIISQAVQAAINEAKSTVALNSQKSTNWEVLASIYRNVLNVAQGADVWTISSYQRAIILDPQNPLYRLNLGGVYYSLNSFDEALKMFEQTTALKSDWPNAYYNLAWSAFQKTDYPRAVREMQTVLSLLNPKRDEADYLRAQKDLTEFKKKLPVEETSTAPASAPQQLSLPTPQPTLEPRLKLPKEASPEAK